jgi:hypothetical protein
MSDKTSNEAGIPEASNPAMDRRLFLQSLGKWSGAAITAVIAGSWLASAPQAQAGAWVNRRCGGGGAWVNRYGGGGGGWVNRYGGGAGWINRYGGGGTGWVNRYGGGGGAWVNRW